MRVSFNAHKVSFGERGGYGSSHAWGSYASLVEPGKSVSVESLPLHNYEYLKLQQAAKEAEKNIVKFTHEEVLSITHLRTLPERLAKIADILQLKKLIKM